MDFKSIKDNLLKALAGEHFRVSTISTERVPLLTDEIASLYDKGDLNGKLYHFYLKRFDRSAALKLPGAKYLIIVAIPQLKEEVEFKSNGVKFFLPVPPTYNYRVDETVSRILRSHLQDRGYRICKARIPLKLAAARSGLARYGRSNISFIEGLGSYYRLVAFYTDFPGFDDQWCKPLMVEKCETCTACLKRCPTQAISKDRFLILADRCLTFLNESKEDFPEWLDNNIHHSLIGCLRCQEVCPLNKPFKNQKIKKRSFSESETGELLAANAHVAPRESVASKLDRLGLKDDLYIVSRNLKEYLHRLE